MDHIHVYLEGPIENNVLCLGHPERAREPNLGRSNKQLCELDLNNNGTRIVFSLCFVWSYRASSRS